MVQQGDDLTDLIRARTVRLGPNAYTAHALPIFQGVGIMSLMSRQHSF